MTAIGKPTAEDMARDLRADYESIEGDLYREDEPDDYVPPWWRYAARRALHAEAENARVRESLRGLLGVLDEPQIHARVEAILAGPGGEG